MSDPEKKGKKISYKKSKGICGNNIIFMGNCLVLRCDWRYGMDNAGFTLITFCQVSVVTAGRRYPVLPVWKEALCEQNVMPKEYIIYQRPNLSVLLKEFNSINIFDHQVCFFNMEWLFQNVGWYFFSLDRFSYSNGDVRARNFLKLLFSGHNPFEKTKDGIISIKAYLFCVLRSKQLYRYSVT